MTKNLKPNIQTPKQVLSLHSFLAKNLSSNKQLLKVIRVVNILLVVIFAIGLVIFILLGVKEYLGSFVPNGYNATTGSIVRTETIPGYARGNKSVAIISFQVNDTSYEFENPVVRPSANYPYNRQINVAYNPLNPNDSPVNIDELPTLRKSAMPNIAFGLFIMALSIYFLYSIKKGVKKYKIK